ncbi:MAG: response regulator [Planctomycetaceae bacterium]|nr:response regulator [Planctomycetaceae bacterium]
MAEPKDAPSEGTRVLLCADPALGSPVEEHLRGKGITVDAVTGRETALDRIREVDYTVVLSAIRPTGMPAPEFVDRAKALRPGVLVVMLTAKVEVDVAIECIRRGAWDFLRAPCDPEDLLLTVQRAAEHRRIRDRASADRGRVPAEEALRRMLKSQYHAALAMLREAVERCPDALWDDPAHTNRTWQIAYHALFFARYYGGPDERFDDFWEGHRSDTRNPDGIPGPPEPSDPRPHLPDPYTKAEVLAFWERCNAGVDAAVDALDLEAPQCGFPWYPIPKLEHQLVNLRHIQHHAGQISERLRSGADIGIAWAGARRR